MGTNNSRTQIAQARRLNALGLRQTGASYQAISESTGVSLTQAYNDIKRALADLAEKYGPAAKRERALMMLRYDRLLLAHWPKAVGIGGEDGTAQPDLKEGEFCLKIMAQMRQILGLDTAKEPLARDVDEPAPLDAPHVLDGQAYDFREVADDDLDTILELAKKYRIDDVDTGDN